MDRNRLRDFLMYEMLEEELTSDKERVSFFEDDDDEKTEEDEEE